MNRNGGQLHVSAIIPNWNGEKYLYKCLESISKQTIKFDEVILVDNGSVDNSIEIVKIMFPFVKIIHLETNVGYAKAINIGSQLIQGDYVALLNNDIELDEKWVECMLSEVKLYKASSYTSRIMNYYVRDIIDDAGNELSKLFIAKKFGYGEKYNDNSFYSYKRYCFGFSGAASMIAVDMLKKLGGFNNEYFAYLEDVDFSLRMNLINEKCLYIPTAVAYHIGSASTGSRYNETTVYLTSRNHIYLVFNSLPKEWLYMNISRIIIGIIYRILSFGMRGHFYSCIKGIIDGIRYLNSDRTKQLIINRKNITYNQFDDLLSNSSRVLKSK